MEAEKSSQVGNSTARAKTWPTWIEDGSPLPDPHGYGERAVRFLKALRHPKSTAVGNGFQLDPWAERIVRRIYGDTDSDGRRNISTVFAMIGRGSRKTSLGAALCLLHTIGPERSPAAQNYVAAVNRGQAAVAFAEACSILDMHPKARAGTHVINEAGQANARMIARHLETGATLEALATDGKAQHGRTPRFVLADELHAWTDRDYFTTLQTAMPKTPESLMVIITTAGNGMDNVAFETYAYARKVALGEVVDPSFLPILFEPELDADWQDEATWHAANPGLALGYPDLRGLRQAALRAKEIPAEAAGFKQLHANMWQDGAASEWLDMATYDEGREPLDLDALRELPCWIGVDFSLVNDLTAVVAVFRDEERDRFLALPRFFVPENGLKRRARADGANYPLWRDQDHLTVTPGDVQDELAVEEAIRDLCDLYQVQEVCCDPWKLRPMMARLLDSGIPAVEVRQGWQTMSPMVEEMQKAILSRRFVHGGHSVLRWCFSNVATRTDPAGNQTFAKNKSTGRIDGAVAATMALGRAAQSDSGRSIYDDVEARPNGLLFF